MGVEPYLLASTVNMVIAQRLVRRICDRCKEPVQMDEETLRRMKISPDRAKDIVFYHGAGCNTCGHTGYLGRLPIFEFLAVDKEIRRELVAGAGESKIREISRKKGYNGLFESGISRVLAGLTTAEEVLSVTFVDKE